jgi:hypothetical protein
MLSMYLVGTIYHRFTASRRGVFEVVELLGREERRAGTME